MVAKLGKGSVKYATLRFGATREWQQKLPITSSVQSVDREGLSLCRSQSPEELVVGIRWAFPDAQCGVRPAPTNRTWFQAFPNVPRTVARISACFWEYAACSLRCLLDQIRRVPKDLLWELACSVFCSCWAATAQRNHQINWLTLKPVGTDVGCVLVAVISGKPDYYAFAHGEGECSVTTAALKI